MSCGCNKNCPRVVPGLLTNGLGGNATSLIIARYGVLGCNVSLTDSDGKPIPLTEITQRTDVWITITYRDKIWRTKYTPKRLNIVITLLSVTNDIVSKTKRIKNETDVVLTYVKSEIYEPTIKYVKSSVVKYYYIGVEKVKSFPLFKGNK